MDRRNFLALAASAPLSAGSVRADDERGSAPGEQPHDDTTESGTDTVKIAVRIV